MEDDPFFQGEFQENLGLKKSSILKKDPENKKKTKKVRMQLPDEYVVNQEDEDQEEEPEQPDEVEEIDEE